MGQAGGVGPLHSQWLRAGAQSPVEDGARQPGKLGCSRQTALLCLDLTSCKVLTIWGQHLQISISMLG